MRLLKPEGGFVSKEVVDDMLSLVGARLKRGHGHQENGRFTNNPDGSPTAVVR